MSGPSDKALDAAVRKATEAIYNVRESRNRALGVGGPAAAAALKAAHDPALGLDCSVCLREVVEALQGKDALARLLRGRQTGFGELLEEVADFIEHIFTETEEQEPR